MDSLSLRELGDALHIGCKLTYDARIDRAEATFPCELCIESLCQKIELIRPRPIQDPYRGPHRRQAGQGSI